MREIIFKWAEMCELTEKMRETHARCVRLGRSVCVLLRVYYVL